MKVCNTCRSQVGDQYTNCPNCGSADLTVQGVQNYQQPMGGYQQPMNGQQPMYNQPVQEQKGNIGWGILGFFIPLVGLILYLVWKDKKPGDAKVAGIGAIAGFCFTLVVNILL